MHAVPGLLVPSGLLLVQFTLIYQGYFITGTGSDDWLPQRQWSNTRKIWMKESHYSDVIMGTMASQINSLMIVYSTVYSRTDQRKHQSSASLAFVRGIHRWPVNSPHKGPVMRKMCPFDDTIMTTIIGHWWYHHNGSKHNKAEASLLVGEGTHTVKSLI